MTRSILHPGERRPVNKATMDAPQEEFLEDEGHAHDESVADWSAAFSPHPVRDEDLGRIGDRANHIG